MDTRHLSVGFFNYSMDVELAEIFYILPTFLSNKKY